VLWVIRNYGSLLNSHRTVPWNKNDSSLLSRWFSVHVTVAYKFLTATLFDGYQYVTGINFMVVFPFSDGVDPLQRRPTISLATRLQLPTVVCAFTLSLATTHEAPSHSLWRRLCYLLNSTTPCLLYWLRRHSFSSSELGLGSQAKLSCELGVSSLILKCPMPFSPQ